MKNRASDTALVKKREVTSQSDRTVSARTSGKMQNNKSTKIFVLEKLLNSKIENWKEGNYQNVRLALVVDGDCCLVS
jgi:hypothetical protein